MGFVILEKSEICPNTKLIIVQAPQVSRKAEAGQFVTLILDETGERIPLTLADWDMESGTITLIFQEIGKSTYQLGSMKPGEEIAHLVGPLGKPSEIKNYGTVLMAAGGVGVAPIYPIARALKQAGNQVLTVLAARCADLLFWEDRFCSLSSETKVCTDDGSKGIKGVVTVPIKDLLEEQKGKIHRVYAIGPAIMMKFVAQLTKTYQIPTVVSLNAIMVDGTGMCGACRVEVGGKTKFSCVDGPEFDGHQVNFELLIERQKMYLAEEKISLAAYQSRVGA